MSRVKPRLGEPEPDSRTHDERGATVERLAKDWVERSDTGISRVIQSPIERAVKRGTLTSRQGLAAERFHAHWYGAQMAGTIGSADLLKIFGTTLDFTKLGCTDQAVADHQCWKKAQEVVRAKLNAAGCRGDHGIKLLDLIVCREVPFQPAGEAIGFGAKDADIMARTLMRSALNILIDQWGL